jgi:uncharacterized protein YabE (DUF348 family)
MRRLRRLLFTAALGLTLLALGGLALHKTITLVVDGETRRLTTYAWSVGGALQQAGIALGPEDRLRPPIDSRLNNGDILTIERAAQVQVVADGQIILLLTPDRLPAGILEQADITLLPGDQLLSNGAPISPDAPLPRASTHSLQVRRAAAFTLQDGAETLTLRSAAPTLGQALWEAGIQLAAADRLAPSPETALTPGLQATLARARPVTIQTHAQTIAARTAAATVGEALAEAGLAPQGLDYSQPAADQPIPADGAIRLVRVQETVLIEQAPLPFETVEQPVGDLELDSQKVLQAGAYGLSAQRVRVRYEDGLEITRTVEAEWVAVAPEPRIVGYGAQVVMHTLDTPDGPITYWRALSFWATSYHPGATGSSRTASGKTLRKGLVGVDTTYIPFGTQMYVPGYGFAEAADTGRIIGRWIDLGYEEEDYVPWHQWVTVYFLWPPPAYIPPTIPPPLRY